MAGPSTDGGQDVLVPTLCGRFPEKPVEIACYNTHLIPNPGCWTIFHNGLQKPPRHAHAHMAYTASTRLIRRRRAALIKALCNFHCSAKHMCALCTSVQNTYYVYATHLDLCRVGGDPVPCKQRIFCTHTHTHTHPLSLAFVLVRRYRESNHSPLLLSIRVLVAPSNDKAKPELVRVLWLAKLLIASPQHRVWSVPHCVC